MREYEKRPEVIAKKRKRLAINNENDLLHAQMAERFIDGAQR